jgi:chromosome segregation ATPase
MAKDINTNINIHTNTDDVNNDFKSLRTQLREAQLEVATLSEKFGATSQEAVNAAKRAGELKDRIGDAKALTDAFNPDAKFNALTNSLAGVASGFGAVQGGMNLLGIQSESTEQALLKVQSAMAISSGLQAIGESVDSFKQMKAVAIDAFNSIKTAIGTTGIGALVIALGLVITYWDDIAEAVSSATKETLAYEDASKGVSESLQKVNENLLTSKLAIQDARKGIISKSEALKIYNEKLGDAFGKTDDLNVAEQRLLENTSKYIQSQIARANAAAFVAKASEAATKAASGEDVKLDWWQEFKVMALSINGIMTKSAIKLSLIHI